MRYIGAAGLALLVTTTAAQAGAGIVPVPPEWKKIVMPGFSIQPPGPSWFVQTSYEGATRDGSVKGQFPLQLFSSPASTDNPIFSILGLGHSSTAVIDVGGLVLPVAGHDPKAVVDAIMDYSKKRTEREVAGDARMHSISSDFTEVTVNGALCVRWEATTEDRGVPHHEGELYTLTMHRLMCSDPEFPAYTARVDYSLRMAPGEKPFGSDEAGLAVLNSLKFTHLGYRITFIPVGPSPKLLTEADGAIWVGYGADDGKVARIDPKTNSVAAVIPVGQVPVGIAADASGVWVANLKSDTVSRIDPKTNAVAATIKVLSTPEMLVSGAGSIWVTAHGAGSVVRIDPATGTVTAIPGVAKQPAGMVFANGSIFMTDYANDKIVRVDPTTSKIAGTVAGARSSNIIIADGPYLWINSQGKEPAVLRLDPASPAAAPLKFMKTIDYLPTGLALWNGKLWVANWSGSSLSVLDPQNPDAAGEFLPVGEAPFGILAAHGSLWVTVVGEQAVLRFDPE